MRKYYTKTKMEPNRANTKSSFPVSKDLDESDPPSLWFALHTFSFVLALLSL